MRELLQDAGLPHMLSVNAGRAGRIDGVDVYIAVDCAMWSDTKPVFRVIHSLSELKSELHIRRVALERVKQGNFGMPRIAHDVSD